MRYCVIYFQCLCYFALPLCTVSMHLTRCALWHVVCLFLLFLISCFKLQFMRIKMYIIAYLCNLNYPSLQVRRCAAGYLDWCCSSWTSAGETRWRCRVLGWERGSDSSNVGISFSSSDGTAALIPSLLLRLLPLKKTTSLHRLILSSNEVRYDMIRVARCYFNVCSKADLSPLNLPHGTNN